ncbi:hypothetical protein KA005_09355 [bacterium]|nr:hypothetical protein [bacterium]
MKTPLLDAIKRSFVDLNGGFRYFPMDVEPQKIKQSKTKSGLTEPPAPDLPATIENAQKARGTTSQNTPRGPQATPMTSSRDNIAHYQPKQ